MMRIKYGELYLKLRLTSALVFLSIFFVAPAQAEKWAATEFTIIQEAPVIGTTGDKIKAKAATQWTNITYVTLDKDLLEQMETYLKKVGERYAALGFMSPSLPIKNSKFVIHMFDYDDEKIQARFRIAYTTPNSYALILDRSRITATELGVQLTPKIWEDLAHELFHAVLASYPLVKANPTLGDWVWEGTAEAMGIEMAKKYKSLAILDIVRWGARSYSRPLRVEGGNPNRTDDAYWSSSLWRYIGEYISNGSSNVRASKESKAPDYSYLAELLKNNIDAPIDEEKELDWLDKGLRKTIGVGLDEIYSKFVTTFSHYVPDRFGTNAYSWRSCLYVKDAKCRDVNKNLKSDVCKIFDLKQGFSKKVEFDLSKVGSDCLEVRLPDADEVNISLRPTQIRFYVEGNDKKQLESIWIGTKKSQNDFESKAGEKPKQNPGPGGDFRSWIYTMTSSSKIFTISNIASKPSETEVQKFTLAASYPHNEVDVVAPPSNGGN